MLRVLNNSYDPDYSPADPSPVTGTPPTDFFADNPPPTTTGGPSSGQPSVSAQDFVKQWQQTHAAHEGIGALADAMKAAGYGNVSRFMYGATPSNNELSIDGQKYKVISGEDSSNPSWYVAGTDDGGGGGSAASGGTFSYPAFNETFSYPTWDQHFQAPTADSLSQDPGFATRLKEGQKALERSAASKGTLLTGGTLKGIVDFGQQMASQEYGNVYNRDRMQYESNYNDYLGNYGRALGEFGQKAGLQNQGYQQALGTYQQSRADQNQQFGQLFNMANFGADNAYRNNQLDFNYANLYGNTLTGGTTQGNDYNLQGANANAAGRVGSANAWGNAFSNAANPAWNALFYSNLMGKTPPPTSRGY